MSQEHSETSPLWDDEFARKLIGAKLLIGLTTIAPSGEEAHSQYWGHVQWADEHKGISILKSDGSEWVMPPALEHLKPAESGTYHLKSTGEDVVDPDYLVTFILESMAHET